MKLGLIAYGDESIQRECDTKRYLLTVTIYAEGTIRPSRSERPRPQEPASSVGMTSTPDARRHRSRSSPLCRSRQPSSQPFPSYDPNAVNRQ